MKTKGVKIHYAWFVMIGCCFVMFYGQGLAQNLFSLFMMPLIDELELSQTHGSSIASIMSLAPIISVMFANHVFNKGWIRKFTFLFGLMMGAGYILMANADSLFTCYAAALIIGLGCGGGVMIPISILLTRWFNEKRGIAFGLVTASSGIANTVMAPIINFAIVSVGVHKAFYLQAVLIILMGIAAMLLIRDCPEKMGMKSYGAIESLSSADNKTNVNHSFKNLIRQSMYWKLTIVAITVGGTLMTVINRLPSFLQSVGFSMETSALCFSMFGFAMIIGKLIYGKIIDWLGNEKSTAYIFAVWFIGIFLSMFIGTNEAIVYIFVIITGLGSPIGTMLIPILVDMLSEKGEYNTMYSSITFIQYLGISGCLLLMGVLVDITGTYKAGFIVFLLLLVISFIILTSCFRNNRGKQ